VEDSWKIFCRGLRDTRSEFLFGSFLDLVRHVQLVLLRTLTDSSMLMLLLLSRALP
jgi:hypothetical protein